MSVCEAHAHDNTSRLKLRPHFSKHEGSELQDIGVEPTDLELVITY